LVPLLVQMVRLESLVRLVLPLALLRPLVLLVALLVPLRCPLERLVPLVLPQVLALEGMAQEALDRPDDAIESYRQAVTRGLQSPDVTTRLAELEQAAADGKTPPVIAKAPADISRQ
jgi:hypothetical protein